MRLSQLWHAPPDFAIAGRTLREWLLDSVSLGRRRTRCFSSIPTSAAASGGIRRRPWPPARTRTAMPRRSTCSPPCASFPEYGPIRKLSSKRSIRCSRGSIRSASSPKGDPEPGRAHAWMPCATTIDNRTRLGVASTYLADRVEPGARCKVYVQKAHDLRCPAIPTADHHDRTRHRHRAVPRLPAGADGDPGARAQLAVLRPSAQRYGFLLRGRVRRDESQRRADPPLARLVARRR